MPEVSESERSPLVDALLELIAWQQKQIEELEHQILKLKGETTKPKIKPSTLDKKTDSDDDKDTEDENENKGKKKGPKPIKTGIHLAYYNLLKIPTALSSKGQANRSRKAVSQ